MKPAKFTTLVVVALVALRLGCGWLFYREGSKKLDSDRFTSEGFLRDAKGPLAGAYQGMIPDIYGSQRLDFPSTEQRWNEYYEDASRHFDFDKPQREQAQLARDRAVAQLRFYLDNIRDDLDEYYNEAERLEEARADDSTASVNYRSTWMEEHEKKLDRDLSQWLAKIDDLWDSYEYDINAIADEEELLEVGDKTMSQLEYYNYYPLPRPGEGGLSSGFADTVIPWFTFIVGALLVLGLFTRVAAVGGAAFLLTVVASQPPFVSGAADTNYQIVLLLALLVIAAVGAGRWGGLDFFLSWGCSRCCGRRSTAQPQPTREVKKA